MDGQAGIEPALLLILGRRGREPFGREANRTPSPGRGPCLSEGRHSLDTYGAALSLVVDLSMGGNPFRVYTSPNGEQS